MKSNEWYKKVLMKNAKKIISSETTYVILALAGLVFLFWNVV